jgi:POT family proton-dependent oligopeptide transporter
VFAALWSVLGRRGAEPSTPAKMVIGLTLVASSFVVLGLAGRRADGGAAVGMCWIVAAYVIQVLGEMCVSPVGLSYVTRTAPARYASLLMASWFLANGVGDKLAGSYAALAPTMRAGPFFFIMGAIVIVSAAVLLVLVPWLRRTTTTVTPRTSRAATSETAAELAG